MPDPVQCEIVVTVEIRPIPGLDFAADTRSDRLTITDIAVGHEAVGIATAARMAGNIATELVLEMTKQKESV